MLIRTSHKGNTKVELHMLFCTLITLSRSWLYHYLRVVLCWHCAMDSTWNPSPFLTSVLKGDNWSVSDSMKNFKFCFFPDAVERCLWNFAWISACLGSSNSYHVWWHSPCFNSQVLRRVLVRTAKTDEQLPEVVNQPEPSASVNDEQSHAAIDQTEIPNTVTVKKSLGTFIRRVIYMKVYFMFWIWLVFEN